MKCSASKKLKRGGDKNGGQTVGCRNKADALYSVGDPCWELYKCNNRHGDDGVMKVVYVCSPYRAGSTRANVRKAKKIGRQLLLEGVFPIIPHIYLTEMLDDSNESERDLGIELGLSLMKRADELYIVNFRSDSSGMLAEIRYWTTHIKRPIRMKVI